MKREKDYLQKVMGIHTQNGVFHLKAGILNLNRTYFAAKINSNFQYNKIEQGLPLIQGVIVGCGENVELPALQIILFWSYQKSLLALENYKN
jgi:hypothetical protein